jgi:hypothetical protein
MDTDSEPPIDNQEHFAELARRRSKRERDRSAFVERAKRTSLRRRRWFQIADMEPDGFKRNQLIEQWRASIYSGDLSVNGKSQVLCITASPLLEDYRLPSHLARSDQFNQVVGDLWMSSPRWLDWFQQIHAVPPSWLLGQQSMHSGELAANEAKTGAVPDNDPALQQKRKPGAKPQWDWDDIEQFAWQELDKRGDFADPQVAEKGWQGYSDLSRLIEEYLETRKAGVGSAPAWTTLKERVPQMVTRWRERSAQPRGKDGI